MPKRTILASVCNAPVANIENNCNVLSQPADANGIIIMKLRKRQIIEVKSYLNQLEGAL